MATSSLNMPYIVLSGVAITSVAIGFAFIRPVISDIRETQHQITEKESLLRERQQFLQNMDRKIAELQLNQQHEQRLRVVLPEEEAVEDVLRIIHQSAQTAGVIVQSVDNNSASVESHIQAQRARGEDLSIPASAVPLAFGIKLNGTYQQLRAFLAELERSPRLTDVTTITITRNEQDPLQLGIDMTLQFYRQQTASL